MMRWVVGSSIKFRRLIIAVGVGLLVFGVLQLDDARTDTLPEFGRTTVEVQTEALGLSAEEVEQLITVPLEQDLLNGVAFLEEIESVSLPGLSSVVMTFEDGTDILDARQVVAERLTQAVGVAGLPHVAELPQMIQPLSSTSRVALVKLTADQLTPIDMSILARWRIVPRLMGVEGVANVSIWGFRDRQLQVLVDPAHLHNIGVALHDVIRTTGNALEVSTLSYLEASSPGTGGFIDTPNQRLHIFHDQAINTARELAEVPIEPADGPAPTFGGEPVTLGDAAQVVEDHQPLIGDTVCTGEDCLLLVVERFPDANTREVTEGVEEALDTLAPGLGGMEIDTSIYRPADHVEEASGNLGWALATGGLLLLLVFALMLPSWRAFVVATSSVAMSLAAAFLVVHLSGAPVDVMLAAGLVAALIVVIDEAVIDADAIARRLRGELDAAQGVPAWRRLLDASLEMRTSMLYATLVVLAVALPAFFLQGEAGAFLPPMMFAYLLAVAAAMLAALTVTPSLAMVLMSGAERGGDPLAVRWWRRVSARTERRASTRAAIAIAAAVVLLVAGVATIPFLDTDMRPSLRERDIQVEMAAAPGTSLARMNELAGEAVDSLSGVPGVEAVAGYVGRAVASDRRVNVNTAQVWLHLEADADHEATLASIRGAVDGFSEVSTRVQTYSEQRVSDILGGGAHDLTVRMYGEDEAILSEKSEEIRGLVAGIDGVDDATVLAAPMEETITVRADIQAAQRFGITPGDVRRTAATLVSGLTVGNLFDEQKVFDAVVWGVPGIRQTVDDVENLLIDSPDGEQVRLGDVATVEIVERPAEIRHESVSTYVDVVADVSGRDVGAVAGDVDAAIGGVAFPFEHHAELLGDYDEARAARTDLLFVAIAALIAIFLLLQAAVSSWRLAALVFAALPLALVGGLVAVVLTGGTITLGSIAGFFAVLTFAARAAVALVRSGRTLRRDEDDDAEPVFAEEAASRRTHAVLTTAVAAIAVYAPFAFAGLAPGLELVRPLARVAIGGSITTVLAVLLVLPAALRRFGGAIRIDAADEIDIVTVPDIEVARP